MSSLLTPSQEADIRRWVEDQLSDFVEAYPSQVSFRVNRTGVQFSLTVRVLDSGKIWTLNNSNAKVLVDKMRVLLEQNYSDEDFTWSTDLVDYSGGALIELDSGAAERDTPAARPARSRHAAYPTTRHARVSASAPPAAPSRRLARPTAAPVVAAPPAAPSRRLARPTAAPVVAAPPLADPRHYARPSLATKPRTRPVDLAAASGGGGGPSILHQGTAIIEASLVKHSYTPDGFTDLEVIGQQLHELRDRLDHLRSNGQLPESLFLQINGPVESMQKHMDRLFEEVFPVESSDDL